MKRITVVAVSATVLLGACSSGPPPAPPTFTMQGTLTLTSQQGGDITVDTAGWCEGFGRAYDLMSGAAVVVHDETWRTLASGSLGSGKGSVTSCRMPWAVFDVPAGPGSYVVTVSDRGSTVVKGADAHSSISLSIANP